MHSRLKRVRDWGQRAEEAHNCAKELAANFDVSSRALRSHFRRHMGASFHKWNTARRMRKARELLAQRLYIKEVAEKLGYSIPSNFSRDFKHFFGIPPTHFDDPADNAS